MVIYANPNGIYGDTYYCYRYFTAVIVLGCADAWGMFTYVNAGWPGLVGDSYTYQHSVCFFFMKRQTPEKNFSKPFVQHKAY